MWLPYAATPEAALTQANWSPKAVLSRDIACLECGRVLSYAAKDVCWERISAPGHGPGSANIVCWCVETGCEEELCDLGIEFHLLTMAQKGMEEIRLLLRRLLEKKFFQKLSCGRGHSVAGAKIRNIQRVA